MLIWIVLTLILDCADADLKCAKKRRLSWPAAGWYKSTKVGVVVERSSVIKMGKVEGDQMMNHGRGNI